MSQTARPLSPHLQIYKWQITMVMSILHRLTGVVLSFGTVLVCISLLALAAGPEFYSAVKVFCTSVLGTLLLVGWSWALCFHLLNGIRHLVWDAGWGFEIPQYYRSGWTVGVLSVLLTLLIWIVALNNGGAA